MIKKPLYSNLFFLVYFFGILSTNVPNPQLIPFQKKVEKVLKKIWKGNEIDIKKIKRITSEKQVYHLGIGEEMIGFLFIDEAIGCHIGGCDLTLQEANSTRYETFYYMAVFDLDLKVKKISILEYSSEYGYEICAKRWLRQFEGLGAETIKYGVEVDAISGATVSGNSLVREIEECRNLLRSK